MATDATTIQREAAERSDRDGMRLEYRCNPRLPKLAWCAEVDLAARTVMVNHGPAVETRDTFFIEGAWNGEFAAGEFSQTECVFGSGGVISGNVS